MLPSINLSTDSLGLAGFAGAGASIFTGGAGTAECGSKPPFFAKKERKEAYEACLAQANEARILMAQASGNPQAYAKAVSDANATEQPNYVLYFIIAAIIITLIIMFKK